MTAARNVYGNVREYESDLDVFGNVFEWDEVTITAPNDGWIANTRARHWIPAERNRLAIAETRDRLWIAESK